MHDLTRIAQLIREADKRLENPDSDALADQPELRQIVDDVLEKERLAMTNVVPFPTPAPKTHRTLLTDDE